MYEELTSELREKAEFLACAEPLNIKNAFAESMKQAADAIEELSLVAESNERSAARWAETAGKAVAQIPQWIPVTERLPEIVTTVIVFGRMKYEWETDYFRFVDAAVYTAEEIFECFHDWDEGQDEFEITHWMPLPEEPKEDV